MASPNTLRDTVQDAAGWAYAALCFAWLLAMTVAELAGETFPAILACLGGFALAAFLLAPVLVLPGMVRGRRAGPAALFAAAWCVPVLALAAGSGGLAAAAARDAILAAHGLLGFAMGAAIIVATLPSDMEAAPVREGVRRHR